MLGVFDSGFGGLTVLKPIHERMPGLSTIYLGDNARAPYGTRTQEEIFKFTLEGVKFLFSQGCPLVVLACNTASSQALRKIQREVLPREFPGKRVLGVIRPAAEYLASRGNKIGIFATPATVKSNAYEHELRKLNPAVEITQVACHGLTDLIESGQHNSIECDALIKKFCDEMLAADLQLDMTMLGCTHYPLVYDSFRALLPSSIEIVVQGDIVAKSLEDYLGRHKEIDSHIEKSGAKKFFTTNGSDVSVLASLFYGNKLKFEKISI
jgi:glutamate racemase